MAGVDLRPLIEFWGIATQDAETSDAAITQRQLPLSAKIYDLLVTYKGLVPKDREAFRDHALNWWSKQPSAEGFTTERNHAATTARLDTPGEPVQAEGPAL